MDKSRFLEERRPAWKRFGELCRRMERRNGRGMQPDEISEFSELFRQLSNDLATVRSHNWGTRLADYLNELVARGHNRFYRNKSVRFDAIREFFAAGFPAIFRRNIAYFWTASALFFVPFFAAALVINSNPALATRVLPGDQLETMTRMYDYDPDDAGRPGITEDRAGMGGFYVRNNVGIALRSFAGGILLGTVTVYVLLSNGISIGVTAGYLISQGMGKAFTSFVIGHGAFELTALAIAGGAGLMLADALIHPGQLSRRDALRVRGQEAVQIAAGAAIMLMIAAVIEAFWSPSNAPSILKYIVGIVFWILVPAYLALAGRSHER